MSDAHALLQEFIAADRDGDADPLAFLARLQGPQRAELEALIDAYLARAPRRAFDRAAFEASPGRAVAEELGRTLDGVSGSWPALLPRLRHRARLRRSELVERLARELGVAPAAKVGRYYHEMEQGTLPAAGVSDRVLEALARVVGTTADRLREAGRAAAGPSAAGASAAAFARLGAPDPAYVPAEELMAASRPSAPEPTDAIDAIDALFTGASETPS